MPTPAAHVRPDDDARYGLSKEALMNLTELFSGELDREAKITRRALGRVPEGRD
jgi:hypothetical protein